MELLTHGVRKSNPKLDQFRVKNPPSEGMYGMFKIPNGSPRNALVIVSSGETHDLSPDWEHVSVSKKYETPTWEEMCLVKNLFWDEEETVIEFHPQKTQYKNLHPYCLHLWRHKNGHLLPPNLFV